MSAGHLRLGISLSITVTVNEQVKGPFPVLSVAEYVIVVVPLLKLDPGAGPMRIGAKLPQLSVAVGSVQVAV